MIRRAITVWATGLLSAACTAATVTVDFTKETGPIRPLNGVNNAPVRIMDYGCWRGDQKEFARARIPFMRTHDTFGMWGGKYVDIPNVFPNFDADENDPANYDFAFTDAYLKDFRLRRLDASHKRTYDATFDPAKGIDINSHGVVFLETKAKEEKGE